MTLYITNPIVRNRRMMSRMAESEWPWREADIAIPLNVKAEEDAFVITAMLPGINADDLNIQIVNETVSLQGEFVTDTEDNAGYLLRERPTGRFCRTLALPDPLDASKAEAEMVNGVLTLRIPKAEEARPKSIKVISK